MANTSTIALRIDEHIRQALLREAAERGIDLSQLLRERIGAGPARKRGRPKRDVNQSKRR